MTNLAQIFASLFGCVTRRDHEGSVAALRAELDRFTKPLGDSEAAEVIALMQANHDIHRVWIEWLETHPGEAGLTGDATHHQAYIERYDRFIAFAVRAQQEIIRLKATDAST